MRGHDHDHDHDHDAELRPKGDRAERDDRADAALLGRAAAAGRPDVLGQAGLLRLQRVAGNAAAGVVAEQERSPVLDVVGSGGGSPLDNDTRADMEARFGQDFGDVRVHNDGTAHESAKSVNAQAYTVGSNIVFQRDKYDPASDEGKHVLAHELTHVVQQRNGPVDGTEAGGGVRVSDPSDRFEREAAATADRLMAAPAPAVGAPAAAPGARGAAAGVQRCEDSGEDAAVQRDAVPPEEAEENAEAEATS